MLRILLATLAGNTFGLAGWQLARCALPHLWAGRAELPHVVLLLFLIAVTSMLVAAPPVLAGALSAFLARRWHVAVGLASGFWSLILVQSVPAALPLAASLWYAPTVLVLLSGALGGWMLAMRAGAQAP
jgi:hypothetical protein